MKRDLLKAIKTSVKVLLVAVGLIALTSCWCPSQMRHCCQQPVSTCPSYTQPTQTPRSPCDPARLPAVLILPRHANPLPVVTMVQERFYSCWSTSAEMIMYFHGLRVPQCVQASHPGDCWCCVEWRLRDECDQASYPQFQRWGFAAQVQYPQPLTWKQATAEIDAGHPFAFSRTENKTSGTMSHMLVAIGYKQPAGPETQILVCLNPRFSTFAEEEDVMFTDYLGSGAIINPTPGGLATPIQVKSDYTHAMTFSGIHWPGGNQ